MTDRSIVTVLYALGMPLRFSQEVVYQSPILDKFKRIQYDNNRKKVFWKL